jgi:hypothetical protein
MNTSTPIPSPNGEFHPGSIESRAKEVRMHTVLRGLGGLYASLVASYGYDAVADIFPALRRQPVIKAPIEPPREVTSAPRAVTAVDVEIAAGQRSMLEDEVPENEQHIDDLLRMIEELHEEGTN